MKPLSKSDYTTGMGCPGHLWMKYHDKENIPPRRSIVLQRFEQVNHKNRSNHSKNRSVYK